MACGATARGSKSERWLATGLVVSATLALGVVRCGGSTQAEQGGSGARGGTPGGGASGSGLLSGASASGAPSAGSGGSSAQSDEASYFSCSWMSQGDVPPRIVVSRWDRVGCFCTWVMLEQGGTCPFLERVGEYCVTDARISNRVADCEYAYTSSGTPAIEVAGSYSVAVDPERTDLDLELTFPGGEGLPEQMRVQVTGCVASCAGDCRDDPPGDPYAQPDSRRIEVREVCYGYEVQLYEPYGFYIGALDYVLVIGNTQFCEYRNVNSFSRIYVLSHEQFDALPDGAPISIFYGACGEVWTEPEQGLYGALDKGAVSDG